MENGYCIPNRHLTITTRMEIYSSSYSPLISASPSLPFHPSSPVCLHIHHDIAHRRVMCLHDRWPAVAECRDDAQWCFMWRVAGTPVLGRVISTRRWQRRWFVYVYTESYVIIVCSRWNDAVVGLWYKKAGICLGVVFNGWAIKRKYQGVF